MPIRARLGLTRLECRDVPDGGFEPPFAPPPPETSEGGLYDPPTEPVNEALIDKVRRRAAWEAGVPVALTAAGVAGVFASPLGFPVMLAVMGVVACSVALTSGLLCRY